MNPYRRWTLLAAAGAILLSALPAAGYDSAGADFGTKSQRVNTPPPPWPFGYGYFQSGWSAIDWFDIIYQCPSGSACTTLHAREDGVYNYLWSNAHAAYAGFNGTDPAIRDLYVCPSAAASGGGLDFTQCSPAPWSDVNVESSAGWVKVRKPWDGVAAGDEIVTGHAPEHMQITMAAAHVAGMDLLTGNLLTQRFWVRYPVADSFVATPQPATLGNVIANTTPALVVGQDWTPTSFDAMNAQAVRSVYLPELAQMPDVSNSVGDWVAADEVCPVAGLSEQVSTGQTVYTFGDQYTTMNACHDFTRVMGTLNESHFLPMARNMFAHYHQLALSRMGDCLTMAGQLNGYYAALAQLQTGAPHRGPNDTEVQVCEREAFVYEMFAEHFLEDAWLTGHMWSRWGTPNMTDFPSDYSNSPYQGFPNTPPTAYDGAARQFAIAAVTAKFSGMIHGAKGLLENYFPGSSSLEDDPLCGPFITSQGGVPVMWNSTVDGGAGPQVGAGDSVLEHVSGGTDLIATTISSPAFTDVAVPGPVDAGRLSGRSGGTWFSAHRAGTRGDGLSRRQQRRTGR